VPIKIIVAADFKGMSLIAEEIVRKDIIDNLSRDDRYVLGLATGSTPTGMYRLLADSANSGAFDCSRIRTFNLDEYVGLPGHDAQQRVMHPESYAHFMTKHLFGLLDTTFARSYLPAGHMIDQRVLIRELKDNPEDWRERGTDSGRSISIRSEASSEYLRWVRSDILDGYARRIVKYGGIDLQVIGVGEKGHVAFHEAGIPFANSEMLLVRLDENTVANAVKDGHFPSIDQSPRYAVSMGVDLVFRARKVLVLASGPRKVNAVARSLLAEATPETPLSYVQIFAAGGGDLVYVLDRVAAKGLLEHAGEMRARGIDIEDSSDG